MNRDISSGICPTFTGAAVPLNFVFQATVEWSSHKATLLDCFSKKHLNHKWITPDYFAINMPSSACYQSYLQKYFPFLQHSCS